MGQIWLAWLFSPLLYSLLPVWDANKMSEVQQPSCDYELISMKAKANIPRTTKQKDRVGVFEQLIHPWIVYPQTSCYAEKQP